MNTEKAINLLDNLIGMVDDNQDSDYDTAFHMAIDALKAQADGDTVSRQAVLENICTMFQNCFDASDEMIESVKITIGEMPSAQPKKRTEERTETHACDLISRQAAIDALGGNEPVGDPSKMDDDDVVKMWERIRIINIINKLPSAQPEIIRCKGCKNWNRESICDGFCSEDCMRHDEDFYCGNAERRHNEVD